MSGGPTGVHIHTCSYLSKGELNNRGNTASEINNLLIFGVFKKHRVRERATRPYGISFSLNYPDWSVYHRWASRNESFLPRADNSRARLKFHAVPRFYARILMKKKLPAIGISSKTFSRCLSLVNIVDRCDETIVACWKIVAFGIQFYDLFIRSFFFFVIQKKRNARREGWGKDRQKRFLIKRILWKGTKFAQI